MIHLRCFKTKLTVKTIQFLSILSRCYIQALRRSLKKYIKLCRYSLNEDIGLRMFIESPLSKCIYVIYNPPSVYKSCSLNGMTNKINISSPMLSLQPVGGLFYLLCMHISLDLGDIDLIFKVTEDFRYAYHSKQLSSSWESV